MNKQQLVNIASKLGYSMQKNGAEAYRIEDSVARVLKALGATDINVFVINSCFMVSMHTEEDSVVSEIRRCSEKNTDLRRIDKLNSLCRKICSDKTLGYEGIIHELDSIDSEKNHPFLVKLFGFTIISAAFSIIFGGGITEAVSAAIIGAITYPLFYFLDAFKTGIFFKNIVASAFISLLAILFSVFILPLNIDKVIIGTFMNLVPGVALVTSMRDIIAGDLISGKNTLTEAIIIALGMALGSGIIFAAFQFLI